MSGSRVLDLPRAAGWLLAGAVACAAVGFWFPRVFRFSPDDAVLRRRAAVELALERLRALGPPVENGYVTASLETAALLEQRLLRAGVDAGAVRASALGRELAYWLVHVYPRSARSREWSYEAAVALDGTVLGLLRQASAERSSVALDGAEARVLAARFLSEQGIRLEGFEPPVARAAGSGEGVSRQLRYAERSALDVPGLAHGVEVRFVGDQLVGFTTWWHDASLRELENELGRAELLQTLATFGIFLPVALLAVAFVKRYHEGLVGTRRAVQIFFVVLGLLLLVVLLAARGSTESWSVGNLTRMQTTWLYCAIQLLVYLPVVALLGFLSFAVGECDGGPRERSRLAAFEALLRGSLGNATVASSALRGVVAGLVLVAALFGLCAVAQVAGARVSAVSLLEGGWLMAPWPGLALLAVTVGNSLSLGLFATVGLVPALTARAGAPAALAGAAAIACALLPAAYPVVPLAAQLVLSLLLALAVVLLYWRYDLLVALLALQIATVLPQAMPLLRAVDPFLELSGWLAVLGSALPLLLSVRHLGSGRVFDYVWDDVPPHVRRIAERERQRVELETARNIQASILPELPESLCGVELAHQYLPASEVGGDFYDVIELAGGRLAVAIGDVAGHGVSSGLVMSMARAALAVLVNHDPGVVAVFRTVYEIVYRSANRRLLTTLCYSVLDPARRELLFASAGHIFPYQVGRDGRVLALESTAYPLGVRQELVIRPRRFVLAAGDNLFLTSDGLIEAVDAGGTTMFGFERLENSLSRYAHRGARGLLRGVLDDLDVFSAEPGREPALRRDDLTVLVLAVT